MNFTDTALNVMDKKYTILRHAIDEFSDHTFEEASLNQILQRANISKGVFYYYFENKKALYKTCQDHALNIFNNYVGEYTQEYEGYIERLLRVNEFKKEFNNRHPYILKFFMQHYYKRLFPADILEHLDQLDKEFKQIITKDINYDLFRDDLNLGHAVQLIQWTMLGYEKSVEERTIDNLYDFNNIDNCFEEYQAYFKTLKLIYYK